MNPVVSTITDWASFHTIPSLQYFPELRATLCQMLLDQEPFNSGTWQSKDITSSSAHDTYELQNVSLCIPMDHDLVAIRPDLPWAENHFLERVGGEPINPGVEHANWPYHANGADLHLNYVNHDGVHVGKYAHNYMERFWCSQLDWPATTIDQITNPTGYRFRIGDLGDVVHQLVDNPSTRQAYLPVFFPEDTGATEGQRVPCTLGYQFLIRDNAMHLTYNLRSCEVYRHFHNDVYMAMRLAEWMIGEMYDNGYKGPDLDLGSLSINITSLHAFTGDLSHLQRLVQEGYDA